MNRDERNTSILSRVKRPLLFIVLTGLVCGSCAQHQGSSGAPFGADDYAFMPARPYAKETALAQKRFQNFLQRANAKQRLTLAETPFVAVRAYQLTASEVPGLTIRMALGRLPNKAYYGADLLENAASVPVEFLLIFDQRTGQLAAPDGVLIIGSPPRGRIGQFGGVRAIYADGGWW
ncbi:MAG: hypothetical protein WA869_35460 [Alloacidobacterium sp.]